MTTQQPSEKAQEAERRQRQEASRSRRAWLDAISVGLLSLFGVPNAA